MNTAVYIAKRYLFSGKKMHAINIISGISMLGVLIGSAALIIILSAFNGLEKVILASYSNFTPEIKIEARIGKTFDPNTPYFNNLRKDPRLLSYTEVLQEKVLIKYGDRTFLATNKGVSDDFLKNKRLDSTVQVGSFTLKSGGHYFAVIGATIQANLGINVKDELSPIQIFSPRREVVNSANPLNEFVVRAINPSGMFAIQQEFDDIVVTPIEFTRDLLDQPKEVSSIELTYKKGTHLSSVQNKLVDDISSRFTVKNRKEQDTELYKTLNFERWSIYMILTFVLIIAIFNIIGSLTMLVIDKRQDIAILSSLGANKQIIQGIFFFEGLMISAIGCIAGVVLGLVFCLLQQHYGFIKMGGTMSMIDAYPIDLVASDFALVFLTVGIISVIASGISARLSVKGLDEIKQDL
ncbi:FtsX-like permease family protein [Mucilaginibacter aquaedulcis]|uniref:FtsX-like permease family protein n=1 Tax=Mucilaginibacter aquaedulcis TaxID=1187081 RepID=UPI0025B62701|nr:FtsX-like permease family protein [Mucilaginibacter aquaedulcis]MDN3550624.1 ABC transporter permease [Mucilaginibacter aquaedulcis]